jgi:hypothetical protein
VLGVSCHRISADYYKGEDGDEVHLQRILNWYHRSFEKCNSGASILLPIGALRALRRLTGLSNGRVLVISGDKGNNHPEQFKGLMDPHIAVHGSFSVMVSPSADSRQPEPLHLHSPMPCVTVLMCVGGGGGSPGQLPRDRDVLHQQRRLRAAQPAGGGLAQGLGLRADRCVGTVDQRMDGWMASDCFDAHHE